MGAIFGLGGIGLAAKLLKKDKKKPAPLPPVPARAAGPSPRDLAMRVQAGASPSATTPGGQAVLGATGGI
jgi:hypothetical protein